MTTKQAESMEKREKKDGYEHFCYSYFCFFHRCIYKVENILYAAAERAHTYPPQAHLPKAAIP